MRILVYGAGNIGTLYAALLKESGQDVSILARGERLAAIRDRGVQLEEVGTGKLTLVPVKAVETLDPDDQYIVELHEEPELEVSDFLMVGLDPENEDALTSDIDPEEQFEMDEKEADEILEIMEDTRI